MSINLHQKHYNGTIENYISSVDIAGYIEKNSSTISGLDDLVVNFVDPVIKLSEGGSFSMGNIYYLKFAVRKDRVAKNNIYVRLEGTNNGATQDIMKFNVPSTDVVDIEDVIVFEKIFQPDSEGYNQIRFLLERSNNDLWDVRDINPTINNLVIDNLDNANDFTFQYNKNTRGKLTVNKMPDSLNVSNPSNKIKLSYDTGEYSLNQYLTLYLADKNDKKYVTLAFSDKENDFSEAASIPLLLTAKSSSSTGKTISEFDETSSQNPNDWQKTTWVNNTGENTFSGDWLMLYYYDDAAMTGKTDEQKLTLNQRNIELYTITNMFKDEIANENTYLTKIGLQAQPGTMFTLNGAELRVGATGVYQIEYPELKINYVGVVPPARYPNDGTKNFFILDYVQVDNN